MVKMDRHEKDLSGMKNPVNSIALSTAATRFTTANRYPEGLKPNQIPMEDTMPLYSNTPKSDMRQSGISQSMKIEKRIQITVK